MDQVAGNEELLNTTKDCLHFMTKFFEPINLSATHIYHSALELSPLSSIVRRLYYNQQHTPFPRVVIGNLDSWGERTIISAGGGSKYRFYTWSPCGQFVAGLTTQGVVEIRDPRSSELLSTLTKPGAHFIGGLAYSPDGCSLACLTNTTLIIWDIQTGGVAKEIGHSGVMGDIMLVWSLDGKTIGTFGGWETQTVHVYNIASDTTQSPGTLQSSGKSHLWGHDTAFQAMTTRWDGQAFIIEIFKVGPTLAKIKSFHLKVLGKCPRIEAFSPTSYHISIAVNGCFMILNVQSSECLLEQKQFFDTHCFSPDGSLFAASLPSSVHIWTYSSGHYISWREFPTVDCIPFYSSPLQFSLNSSSVLGSSQGNLQVCHLDTPPHCC